MMKRTKLRWLASLLLIAALHPGLARKADAQVDTTYNIGDVVEFQTYSFGKQWLKGKIATRCISGSCSVLKWNDYTNDWMDGQISVSLSNIRRPGADVGSAAAKPAAVIQSAQNTTAQAQPQPSAANAQLKYKVGQRVEWIKNGKWYKAIITQVRDDSANYNDRKIYSPYRVHLLGYNDLMDTWAANLGDFRDTIRPAGSGPTEPVPGGEANDDVLKRMRGAVAAAPAQPGSGSGIPTKQYHCVFFAGNQLVDAAPLTITGTSTYTDSDGKRGTFTSAASTLTFHGGNYDGQRAEYETSGGQPQLHILGPSGRRIIDCD